MPGLSDTFRKELKKALRRAWNVAGKSVDNHRACSRRTDKPCSYYVIAHKRALKRVACALVVPLLQRHSSWLDVAVFAGYIGVAVYAGAIVRKLSSRSSKKREYVSVRETEILLKFRKSLGLTIPIVVMLSVLALIGLWYLKGSISHEYIHFIILACAYLLLGYIDISTRKTLYQFAPIRKETNQEKKNIGFVKALWYVNAVVLLIFCVSYTQLRDFPFHGIWGVLTWALALVMTYPAVPLLNSEIFREFVVSKQKIVYSSTIVTSWIVAICFLPIGSS